MHPAWDFAIVAAALPVLVVAPLPVGVGVVVAAIVALKLRLARTDRARDRGQWHDSVGSKLNQAFTFGLVLSLVSVSAIKALVP